MSAGGFLSRWSKRKLAASLAVGQPAAAEAGATAHADVGVTAHAAADSPAGVAGEAWDRAAVEAALPPVDELTLASDFTAFLKEEVSESLRRQALKKLFADPHFNQMDGLDIYIDDYSIADPIPPSMMEKLKHAREWLGEAEAPADADPQAAGDMVLPPVTDGEAVPSETAAGMRGAAADDPVSTAGGASSAESDDLPSGAAVPARDEDERAA